MTITLCNTTGAVGEHVGVDLCRDIRSMLKVPELQDPPLGC